MNLNKRVFYSKFNTMLNHQRAVIALIIIIAISAIAMMATAYLHDTYISVYELKELARMDVWFRVFYSVFLITSSFFIFWPLAGAFYALACAYSPTVSKKVDEQIKKDGESPIRLAINEEMFRALFSESFTNDKFEAFCKALQDNESSLKKCDIGKLAERIMYHSPYCSDNDKYKKKRQFEKEWNFTPYCKDFYYALGISSSIYDPGYFTKSPLAILDKFSTLIDDDGK